MNYVVQGNLKHLQEFKGWKGQEVLYFGDHPYSDLADVSLNHSWRTGAIIWELDVSVGARSYSWFAVACHHDHIDSIIGEILSVLIPIFLSLLWNVAVLVIIDSSPVFGGATESHNRKLPKEAV